MALVLNTCCCGLFSVRSASYCVAFYACIYFIVTLTISVLGLISVEEAQASSEILAHHPDLPPADTMTKVLLVVMIILSALGVVSVVMLVLGLCKDRAWLLLPAICTLSATVILDLAAVIAIIVQDIMSQHRVDSTAVTLLLVDLMTMAVNLWCIVCLVSQYRMNRASDEELRGHDSSLRIPLTPGHSAAVLPPSLVLGRSASSCRESRPPDGASAKSDTLQGTPGTPTRV